MGERARRSDQGSVRWTERDLRVLSWIGEQYAVRLDHLTDLVSRWPGREPIQPGRLGEPTIKGLVRRWRLAGVVQSGKLLVQQPTWVWLAPRGLHLLGLEVKAWDPTLRGAWGLEHRYYVNQARLWLEGAYPEASWTSERLLLRRKGASKKGERADPVPDAEVRLGAVTIAVEVELTAKTEERWQEAFAARAARYDQVWYFTPAHLARDLGRAVEALVSADRAKFSLS